jgi:hypothetical protein
MPTNSSHCQGRSSGVSRAGCSPGAGASGERRASDHHGRNRLQDIDLTRSFRSEVWIIRTMSATRTISNCSVLPPNRYRPRPRRRFLRRQQIEDDDDHDHEDDQPIAASCPQSLSSSSSSSISSPSTDRGRRRPRPRGQSANRSVLPPIVIVLVVDFFAVQQIDHEEDWETTLPGH